VLGIFLLLSCLDGRQRFLEITTHFKLQYCVAALIFALIYGLLRAWRWFGAALLMLLVSGSSLLGWYAKPQSGGALRQTQPLRFLLANVLYDNERYQAVLDLVQREKPDLILFQEFTGTWERQTSALTPLVSFWFGGSEKWRGWHRRAEPIAFEQGRSG
jgi:endonuclease/exonuclease/phosphatase (EEP) superfamily protein YafD